MVDNNIEKIIGYTFKDKRLLVQALTHSSLSSKSKKAYCPNYERLEFLGDRVLGLVLAEYFYNLFPNADEGFLNDCYQKYANQVTLAECAKKNKISSFINTQKGDNLDHNKSVLSDVIESIIGAIYIDSGIKECKLFIVNEIIDTIKFDLNTIKHPKTLLQELCLEKFKSLPKYDVINKSGSDHMPVFTVSVSVDNVEEVIASGNNIKNAEEVAALKLLDILRV